MAWASLLSGFAKGSSKKAKKKGAEMAKNITNKKEKDNSSAIVVREKSTTLAPMFGGGGALDTPIQKPTTKGSPLDRIDSALLDIMNTLKSRRKMMLNKSRRMRVQADKEKKAKREGLLESMKNTGKKMVKNVASASSNWWEKLQRFLLMTLLGSLVTAIMDNWKSIKEKIDKVVKFVQDLWKFMEPVITPLIEGLKWVVKQWSEMGSELMGLSKDKPKVEKETDKLSEDLKALEKTKKDVDGKFKEAEQGVRDLDKKTFDEVAIEAGLGSEVKDTKKGEVEGKTPPTPKRNRDEVTTDKTIKGDLSTITFDGKTFPRGLSGPMETFGGKGGSTYEDGAVPVPETGPAIVHKGEVIIPAPVVKMAGGPMNIENMVNMMQSSTTNIKQNPLKIISIMEGMSKEFAPMGEQIPGMINETIKESKLGTVSKKVTREMVEKMEKTLTVLKEQTEYEDPSGSTVFIPVPTPSQPPMGEGGSSGETTVIMGESGKAALNRYVNAVIQKALY